MSNNRKPLTDEQKKAKVAAQSVRRMKAKAKKIAIAAAPVVPVGWKNPDPRCADVAADAAEWNGNGATPPADAPAPIFAEPAFNDPAPAAACDLTPHEARIVAAIARLGGTVSPVFVDNLDMGKIGGTWAMLRQAIATLANEKVLRVIGSDASMAVSIDQCDNLDAILIAANNEATAAPAAKAKRTVTAPAAYAVGTVLTREYKGRTIVATIRADSVDIDGTRHGSLAAAIKSIVGYPCQSFFKTASTSVVAPAAATV